MTAGGAVQPFQQQLAGATALSYLAQTRAGGVIITSSHERRDRRFRSGLCCPALQTCPGASWLRPLTRG